MVNGGGEDLRARDDRVDRHEGEGDFWEVEELDACLLFYGFYSRIETERLQAALLQCGSAQQPLPVPRARRVI